MEFNFKKINLECHENIHTRAPATFIQEKLLIKHWSSFVEKGMIPFKYDTSKSLLIAQDFVKNYFLYWSLYWLFLFFISCWHQFLTKILLFITCIKQQISLKKKTSNIFDLNKVISGFLSINSKYLSYIFLKLNYKNLTLSVFQSV